MRTQRLGRRDILVLGAMAPLFSPLRVNAQDVVTLAEGKNVQLRLINYSGAMKLFAYANGTEFIAINLDDTSIPDSPPRTTAVEDFAYDASEVHHIADGFIGNDVVHGGGKRLDDAINQNFSGWWNSVKARLLNPKQVNFAVHPSNLIRGKNKFDVSIVQLDSMPIGSCTISLDEVKQGSSVSISLIQLSSNRKNWGQEFNFT